MKNNRRFWLGVGTGRIGADACIFSPRTRTLRVGKLQPATRTQGTISARGGVDRGGLCGFLLLWFLSPPFSFLLQIYIYFPPKQTTQQQKSVVKTPEKQTHKQWQNKIYLFEQAQPNISRGLLDPIHNPTFSY
jgi:hypothetical protein